MTGPTARLRRRRAGDEGGFALIFVMMITTLVLVGTTAVLAIAADNIGRTSRSTNAQTALAAAQSGIADYVANLNAHCVSYSIQTCSWLTTLGSGAVTGTAGTEAWSVSAQSWHDYLTANNGTLRVTARGAAPAGLVTPTNFGPTTCPVNAVCTTLTADITSTPSALRYAYFTDHETVSSAFLNSYYGPRTIAITDNGTGQDTNPARAAGLASSGSVTWKGAGTAPANTYSDSVCDALYYNDPSNSATFGGYAVGQSRTALPLGTDYAEDGTVTPQLNGSSSVTRFAPCELTYSAGMTFDGPVYSQDALYLSNGVPYAAPGAGPVFSVPTTETLAAASTAWASTSTPAAVATSPYRSYPLVGGSPGTCPAGRACTVATSPFTLALPASAVLQAGCTYTGPTRILLSGTTATISSPLTPAGPGPCYTSTGTGVGVVKAQVPIDITAIKVVDGAATQSASLTFPDISVGGSGDVTAYSRYRGDAYVQGSLTGGRLSIVTADDLVVTGDVLTTSTTGTNTWGEPAWRSGAAVDLVATNNVRVYHPVSCRTGTATAGWCPNDITGLYRTARASAVVNTDGSLKAVHPSLQYCNLPAGCSGTQTTPRTVDAAVFALNGSFYTDNFDRGLTLGTLTVNGGVYQDHRGPLGKLWETVTSTSTRASSGYTLRLGYVSYDGAGLPYVPPLQPGARTAAWQAISVSSGGGS